MSLSENNFDSYIAIFLFRMFILRGFAIGDFDNDGRTEFFAGSVHGKVLSIENKGVHSYAPNWQGSLERATLHICIHRQMISTETAKKKYGLVEMHFFKSAKSRKQLLLFVIFSEVGRIDLIACFSLTTRNMQVLDVDNDGKHVVLICLLET